MKRMQLLFTMCHETNAISGFIDTEKLGEEKSLILMFQRISDSHGTCLVTDFMRTTLFDACSGSLTSRIRRGKIKFWKQMYPEKYINFVHSSQKGLRTAFSKNSFTEYGEYLQYRSLQDCECDTQVMFDFTVSDIGIGNLFDMFREGTPKDLIKYLPELYFNPKYRELAQ